MPEIRNHFQQGKMNKDLDERLIPNGQYRDAMNVQVSTSEDSDVGTVQNILGNMMIPGQIGLMIGGGRTPSISIPDNSICVGAIADEKNDTLYWYVYSPDTNYILQYKRNGSVVPVFIDDKTRGEPSVLKFNPDNIITGINIIDDMLIWTDNESEPKKINIQRCIDGTQLAISGFTTYNHTLLINDIVANSPYGFTPVDIEEKHITVIKPSPRSAPVMKLETERDPDKVYSFTVITASSDSTTAVSFIGSNAVGGSNPIRNFNEVDVDQSVSIGLGINGEEIIYGNNDIETYVVGTSPYPHTNYTNNWGDQWKVGAKIVLKSYREDGSLPGIPISDYEIKGDIEAIYSSGMKFRISSIQGYIAPPSAATGNTQKFVVDIFDESEKLFEYKFPRFAYRYKYEDGEYSAFGPFSQVAFIPGTFDYHPRKGYNIGMTNRLDKITFSNFRNISLPKDVVAIDILFKDEASPNVYVVDSITPDEYGKTLTDGTVTDNAWWKNEYVIEKETIQSTVPSNQILRPWDNVPRLALGQDVTGNRIVYANYVQNYTLKAGQTEKSYYPDLSVSLRRFTETATNTIRSIKSLREYQLGVVFIDKYGRETPVITNPTGTIRVEKDKAESANRLEVGFNGGEVPTFWDGTSYQDMKYFKFFVKETSGEYYNMAMDRWYEAEDGNIWLGFPSSDRNKVDIDSFLILKKGVDLDVLVKSPARYKVVAIENEAPDFIKTKKLLSVTKTHTAGTVSSEIFPTNSLTNCPVEGVDEFKLAYADVFHGSSAGNLHNVDSSVQLYIEFTNATKQTSQRYRITSITCDHTDLAQTPAAGDKYNVKVEKDFGDDINFITDDASGNNSTKISDGTIVKIYKYIIEDSPQFDGRFFVKIFKDEVFTENITTTLIGEESYKRTDFRKVYSMFSDVTSSHSQTALATESFLGGFHSQDIYRAMSNYFHKYINDDPIVTNNAPAFIWQANNNPASHITPGDYIHRRLNCPDNFSGPNGFNPAVFEHFIHAFGLGGSSIFQYTLLTHLLGGGNTISPSQTMFNSVENATAKDDETWFIDAGPYVGSRSNNRLDWDYINGSSGQIDYGNGYTYNQGASYYSMQLAMGPIFQSGQWRKDEPGSTDGWENFFGIGDWNSMPGQNPNYTGLVFVKNLNPGHEFRWGQHPNSETIYTIVGNVTTRQRIRYQRKWNRNKTKAGFASSLTFPPISSDSAMLCSGWSHNFTKGWNMSVNPAPDWIPVDGSFGKIDNGLNISIPQKSGTFLTANQTMFNYDSQGFYEQTNPIQIFIDTKVGTDPIYGQREIHVGMALTSYYKQDGSLVNLDVDQYLVITRIGLDDVQGVYEVELSGYTRYMAGYSGTNTFTTNVPNTYIYDSWPYHPILDTDGTKVYTFSQVKMNGYSPHSAYRISKYTGPIGAVGYDLEFVEKIDPTEVLSENPAIFETEPKDIKELDIYYEASGYIPMSIDQESISWIMPIGSKVQGDPDDPNYSGFTAEIIDYNFSNPNNIKIILDQSINSFIAQADWDSGITNNGHWLFVVIKPDGLKFDFKVTAKTITNIYGDTFSIDPFMYSSNYKLPWHNCFSFGNGVESNRIRDNFNLAFITNGVKASTTLEEEYKEERRQYGLIYSGIYNSTSGINNLNQFIQAEKITKDVNPIYGSIQKLHSRDSDLLALCEDKVLKIQANKDALFNADGNTNVTATSNVLGQTIPFVGEYGISTNPESFASESYRAYFTDKVRGAVMRISRDGLTPISDHGMKDWFKDNLKTSDKLIGSYDDKKDNYNLTLIDAKGSNTVSFSESVTGWVSFKSFIPQLGVSMANDYYTFDKGKLWMHHDENVTRNTFYNIFRPSTVNVVLNSDPKTVKVFNTLNYEGSQARVHRFTEQMIDGVSYTDQEHWNLAAKKGWYVSNTITNKQDGYVKEFIEKEGKWFNYIRGIQDVQNINSYDPSEFSYQGIGIATNMLSVSKPPPPPPPAIIYGCTDPLATNYYAGATVDDGTCIYTGPPPPPPPPPPSFTCDTSWSASIQALSDDTGRCPAPNFDGSMDASGTIPNFENGDTWIWNINNISNVGQTFTDSITYNTSNVIVHLEGLPYGPPPSGTLNLNELVGPGDYELVITHYHYGGGTVLVGECTYTTAFTIGCQPPPAPPPPSSPRSDARDNNTTIDDNTTNYNY